MEEQKKILQRPHDPLSDDSVTAGNGSAAIGDDRRRLLINSLVLAVAIPALLRCSGGDPLLAAWSFSLFAVSYLFYCMCFFSITGTSLAKIFVTLFYVGLLAFFSRTLLSNVLGMVIIYLDSVLAAGMFGSILAQHRQSNGTETATLVAVANARAINKKPDSNSRKELCVMLGFMALCYILLVWLMLLFDSPPLGVAVSLFGAISFLQIIHISCVLSWLNGAVFTSDDHSVKVIFYFAFVFWVFFILYPLAGEIVGVTVLWLCILASTAFLGYYHQIHASY